MRRLERRLAEPRPQRAVHERPDIGAGQRPRRRHEGQNFAIVAINGEGHRDHLAAPTGNQEDVRAPALIRGRPLDLTDVRPAVAAMHSRRQHQPVQLHDPANALAVVPDAKGPVHHRPHPTVAVRRPAVRHGADLLEHGLVGGAAIAATRTCPRDVVGRAPGDP
jgi:hypothetical protein